MWLEPTDKDGSKMLHQSHINVDAVQDFFRSIIHESDEVPCTHPGCKHHVTHPCEWCGKVYKGEIK